MKPVLATLLFLSFPIAAAATAQAACYHKVGDRSETLRDTNGQNLLWLHKGKSREFFVHHVGTGIPDMIACKIGAEDFDKCLSVKFRKNKIIFGGVSYVRGCKK